MPIKMGNKRYKSFGSAVSALKKKGKSDSSAKKIVGYVQARQEEEGKGKKNKKGKRKKK